MAFNKILGPPCGFSFGCNHSLRAASASDPDPGEMARTAAGTLKFADVAALRPHLVPEVPIWSWVTVLASAFDKWRNFL